MDESEKRTIPVSRTIDELTDENWNETLQDSLKEIETIPDQNIKRGIDKSFLSGFELGDDFGFYGILSTTYLTFYAANAYFGDGSANIFGTLGLSFGGLALTEVNRNNCDENDIAKEILEDSKEKYGNRFALFFLDGEQKRVDTTANLDEINDNLDNIDDNVENLQITYDRIEGNPFFSIGVKGQYLDKPLPDHRKDEYRASEAHEMVIVGLDPNYEFSGSDDFYDQVSEMEGTDIDKELDKG